MWFLFIAFGFVYFRSLTHYNNERLLSFKYDIEDAREWSGYLCSFIHAIIVSMIATFGIYLYNDSQIFEGSLLYICLAYFSIGYFVNDLLHIICELPYSRNNIMFIVHHIAFCIFCLWSIHNERFHYGSLNMYMTEYSTIIINIFHYCRFYAKSNAGRITNFEKNVNPELVSTYNTYSYWIMLLFLYSFIEFRLVLCCRFIWGYPNIVFSSYMAMFIIAFMLFINVLWCIPTLLAIRNFKDVTIDYDSMKKQQ